MGLLRLILSFSVLIAHTYPLFGYRLLGAQLAVDTFFVISGFYMALILRTKYTGKNGSYSLFVTNRFLRIYPLYWVMLFLTFAFALVKYLFFPASDNVLKLFVEAFSTSPDFIWRCIDGILRNVTLLISTDYIRNATTEPGHLVLLQAWTLQVELLFYLVAPFLVRIHTRLLTLLVIFCSFITFAGLLPGVHATNWVTPAFVYSLLFFLVGILSYRLYEKVQADKSFHKLSLPVFSAFLLIALVFGYFLTSADWAIAGNFSAGYFLLVFLSLPFIFLYTHKSSLDALIGSLSYPVYISHFFVYKLIENSPISSFSPSLLAVITIITTLIFSYFLLILIERPLDRLRAGRLRR